MSILGIISAAAAVLQFSPPGASLTDQLFAYGALLFLVALIVWQEWTTPDPDSGN